MRRRPGTGPAGQRTEANRSAFGQRKLMAYAGLCLLALVVIGLFARSRLLVSAEGPPLVADPKSEDWRTGEVASREPEAVHSARTDPGVPLPSSGESRPTVDGPVPVSVHVYVRFRSGVPGEGLQVRFRGPNSLAISGLTDGQGVCALEFTEGDLGHSFPVEIARNGTMLLEGERLLERRMSISLPEVRTIQVVLVRPAGYSDGVTVGIRGAGMRSQEVFTRESRVRFSDVPILEPLVVWASSPSLPLVHARRVFQGGEEEDTVTLLLEVGRVVEGIVVDGETGEAVPDAWVSNNWDGDPNRKAQVGGRFRLLARTGRSLGLHAGASGYLDTAVELEGHAGTQGLRIPLHRAGVLRGRVMDSKKAPIQGAKVTFSSMVTPEHGAGAFSGHSRPGVEFNFTVSSSSWAVTGEDGGYELLGMPWPRYAVLGRLKVDASSLGRKFVEDIDLELALAQGLDVTLDSEKGGSILEVVVEGPGAEHVRSVTWVQGETWGSQALRANRCRIENLTAGVPVHVAPAIAVGNGGVYECHERRWTGVPGLDESCLFDSGGLIATVEGRVKARDGHPLAGAWVYASYFGGSGAAGVTDDSGLFTLVLPADVGFPCRVEVRVDGFGAARREVSGAGDAGLFELERINSSDH
jgi:hypothetical protein